MKNIGIYSDQFKIDLNSKQENWFTEGNEKYSQLNNDPLDSKNKFQSLMYDKYNFAELEAKIGYSFKDRSLLVQAFKHPTHMDCKEFGCYESLEFLGDSVIDYLIVRYIFDASVVNKLTPGQLSTLKQSFTNNSFFGSLSVKYGLDQHLIFRNKMLFDQIGRFKEYYKDKLSQNKENLVIANSYVLMDGDLGNVDFDNEIEVPKVLSDIFEALIAAVFIDSNFCLNTVWSVLHRFMANELIEYRNKPPKTFLTYMYEQYPKAEFENIMRENNLVRIEIYIEKFDTRFTGEGPNLKSAKMNAAKKVLRYEFDEFNSSKIDNSESELRTDFD